MIRSTIRSVTQREARGPQRWGHRTRAALALGLVSAAALAVLPAGCGSKRGPAVDGARDGTGEDAHLGGGKTGAVRSPSAVAGLLEAHNLRGRPVLVEFGTVGCSLSESGLRAMVGWHRREAVPGLSYLRLEASRDAAAVKSHYKGNAPPPFPVVGDPDMALARELGATVYPRFVLLDRFARVRYRGKLPSVDDLSAWAGALAEEKTDPGPDVPLFGAVKLDVPKLLASTALPDLSGKTRPLGDYRGGKGLLVVFVDTTCPFSGEAMRDMRQVAGVMKGHGVPAVLVNIDDPADEVREFHRKHDVGVAVVYDVDTGTQLKWNVQSFPTVMLIGPDDRIAYKGPAVWARLAAAAAKTLGVPAGVIRFRAKGTEFG